MRRDRPRPKRSDSRGPAPGRRQKRSDAGGLPAPAHPQRAAAHRRASRATPSTAPPLALTAAKGRTLSADELCRDADWAAVARLLRRCGADEATALPLLARYVALLLEWNRSVSNLVSRADEERLVSRHLLESLEPAAELASAGLERWLDLGSGAGLPAIPLAIAGVGKRWVLVESRRPKILFMRKVLQELALKNIVVEHARLEACAVVGGESGDPEQVVLVPSDGFTSRATMRLAPTLELAADFVVSGGHAFLWKGSRREEEMARPGPWNESWQLVREIALETSQSVVVDFIRND